MTTDMADPSWLLATTAQSAAALVAIIGGLLASRLVTLSSEREALDRTIERVQLELRQREERALFLALELKELERLIFTEYAVDHIAAHDWDMAPDELARRVKAETYYELRIPEADLETVATQALKDVQEIGEAILSTIDRSHGPIEDLGDLQLAGYAVSQRERDLVEAVFEHLNEDDRFGPQLALDSDAEKRRQRLLAEEEEVEPRRFELRLERGLLEAQRDRLAAPPDIRQVRRSLALFAVTGVVWPILLLAWLSPGPGDGLAWWWPASVVVGFLVGLGALGWYFWRSVGSSSSSAEVEGAA